jgi:hypothetical protein
MVGPVIHYEGGIPDATIRASLYNSGKGKTCANMSTADKTNAVACWEMDEDGGPYVDSIGSNDLTAVNTPTRVAGLVERSDSGMSVRLNDADGSYLFHDTWDGIRTNSATGITVSYWINQYNSDDTNITLQQTWHTPTQQINSSAYAADGIAFLYKGANEVSSFVYSGNGSTTENAWNLATMWWDPSDGKACVQIDAETPVCSASVSTAISGSTRNLDFRIAAGSLDAILDDYSIWYRVLTADERTTLWNSGAGTFYAAYWDAFFEGDPIRFAWSQRPRIRRTQ